MQVALLVDDARSISYGGGRRVDVARPTSMPAAIARNGARESQAVAHLHILFNAHGAEYGTKVASRR